MFILGLTGSLGMGKSTTAKFFAEEGVPVHDADAAVHRLYAGEAAPLIEAAFPGTTADGKVDRDKLGKRVLGEAAAIKRLEQIVHPLVRQDEERFLAEAERAGAKVAVLDIPLLFETRRRQTLRRGGGGLGAGRDAARARLRAAGHERREVPGAAGQADARRREARARRFHRG